MFSKLFIKSIELKENASEVNEDYSLALPALSGFNKLEFNKNVTFFIGENGSGKSTLLEGIAVASGFNPEGGSRNFSFSSLDTHSGLHHSLILSRTVPPKDSFFLRAESFYNVATEIERLEGIIPSGFYDNYGGKSLHAQSHGESFMTLIEERFRGNGLYILDEPEAALSPQRQLALLYQLHRLSKMNSQFIIATHSPILMAYPDSDIYQLDESGIELVDYKDTEHYILTKSFIDCPEKYLKLLFENEK